MRARAASKTLRMGNAGAYYLSVSVERAHNHSRYSVSKVYAAPKYTYEKHRDQMGGYRRRIDICAGDWLVGVAFWCDIFS